MRGIAVIIPLFAGEHHILATLRSVADQGDVVSEIIIIDDSSTDNAPEIVTQFATSEPRLQLHRVPNMGQNAARNVGASLTSAPYLKFLDQDDLLPPNALLQQLDFLTSNKADILIGSLIRFHDEHEVAPILKTIASTPPTPPTSQPDFITACHEHKPTFNEILITRDAFNQSGGFNPKLGTCEEFDLAVRLHLRNPHIKVFYQNAPPVTIKRCGKHSLAEHYRKRINQDRNWAQICCLELANTILDNGHAITALLKERVFDSLYILSTYAYRGGKRGYGLAGYEVWREARITPPKITPSYHYHLHRILGFPIAEAVLAGFRAFRPRSSKTNSK